MGLKEQIRKLLLIQKRELSSVTFLFIYSFLLGFPQIATITSSNTLLLESYEPEFIPNLFLLNGSIISVISLLFLLVLSKRHTKSILSFISLTMIVGSIVITLLNLLFPLWDTLKALLFLWSRVENTFLAAGFLIIANTLLTPRTSRRVLAFAASGQVVSLIIGGVIFPYLLKEINPIHLMWFSVTAHILIFLHLKSVKLIDETSRDLREGRIRSPLLRNMYITFSLAYLLYYIIDSSFLAIVDMELPSSEVIGAFFSRFWLVVGISALICKTLITGKLLHRFGLLTGLLLPPLLLTLYFFSGTIIDNKMTLIVGLKFIERVFFASIFIPAFYTLFQAFRFEVKQKSQLISETVLTQVTGIITGGIFILLKQREEFSIELVLILMLTVLILITLSSIFTYKSYKSKMLNLLKKPEIKLLNHSDDKFTNAGEDKEFNCHSSIMKLIQFRDFCPDNHDSLLFDVWYYEWNTLVNSLLTDLSNLLSDRRVVDRWYKIRERRGRDRAKLLEGYSQLIEPPWRDPILSIINDEESFLIRQAIKPLSICIDRSYSFQIDNPTLTEWTKTILSKSINELKHEYHNLNNIRVSQFFSRIPTEYLHTLLPSFRIKNYNKDEFVIREGDSGDSMFILVTGSCSVIRGENCFTTIQPGECVGELALILPEKRSASIVTRDSSTFLELPGEDFISFINQYPVTIQNIQTVLFIRMEAHINQGEHRLLSIPEPYITDLGISIKDLESVALFNHIEESVLENLSMNLEYIDLNPGDSITIDKEYPSLVIIKSGEVIEYWGDREINSWSDGEIPASQLLIQNSYYTGYLVAVKRTTLIMISSDVYTALLQDSVEFQKNLTQQLVAVNRLLLKKTKLQTT